MAKRQYNEAKPEVSAAEFESNYSVSSTGSKRIKTETFDDPVGAIKLIDLVNFMCHEHLRVEFNNKLNFVIGRNGSGKSAILTGIILCLGGKASATNRATALKTLVREGQNVATLTLVLWNKGLDAYRPDIYGDTITIERKISREASMGYKIKSHWNKTITTKKEELVAICDHMKIQADNPISILSQETAKKFIGNTTPKDKYQMFMKATHLSQLREDLDRIKEASESSHKILEGKKVVLPKLAAVFKEAKLKHHQLEEAQNQQQTIQLLKNQIAWAQVVDKEKEHAKLQSRTDLELKKIEQFNELSNKHNEDESRLKALLNEHRNRMVAQSQMEAALNEKSKEANRVHLNALSAQKECERTISKIKKEIKDKNNHYDLLTKRISSEKAKLQLTSGSKLELAKKHLANLLEDNQNIQDEIVNKEKIISEKEGTSSNLAAKRLELETEKNDLNKRLGNSNKQLQMFQSAKANHLNAYGASMVTVLQAINAETRWTKKPLGPLGLFIELKDSRWSPLIERLLDSAITSFIVSNFDDRQILSNILKTYKCHVRIYISSFDNFEFSSGEPDHKYLTILRALKFKDEQVMRQLIVTNKIEKVILINQRKEGDDIMRVPPHNVTSCYSSDGFQMGLGGKGWATMAVKLYDRPPRISQAKEDQITLVKKIIQDLEKHLSSNRQAFSRVEAESKELDASLALLKDEIAKAKRTQQENQLNINQIETEIQDEAPTNIAALESALQENQDSINLTKNQLEGENDQLLQLKQKSEETSLQLETIKQELAQMRVDKEAYQDHIDKTTTSLDKLQTASKYYTSRDSEARARLQDLQNSLTQAAQEMETLTSEAQQYCPERVDVNRSLELLQRDLERAEKILMRAQDSVGLTLEQSKEDIYRKGKAYKTVRDEIAKLDNFIKDLEQAWLLRSTRWNQFRQHMSRRIKLNFGYNLHKRGFQGKLSMLHEEEELIPIVKVTEEVKSSSQTDPKSLSGGEKSFSTICLLLALWDSMECPIRCLDEYDVFMDAANRKVSTKMIIDSARMSRDVQYILITPQSMDEVELGNDICVTRLKDPRPAPASSSTEL